MSLFVSVIVSKWISSPAVEWHMGAIQIDMCACVSTHPQLVGKTQQALRGFVPTGRMTVTNMREAQHHR